MVLYPPANEPSTPLPAGPGSFVCLAVMYAFPVCDCIQSWDRSECRLGSWLGPQMSHATSDSEAHSSFSQTEGNDAGNLRRDFGMYLPSDGAAPVSPFSPGGIQHTSLVPELESSHILFCTSPSFQPLPWSVSPQHSDMRNEPGRLWGFLK